MTQKTESTRDYFEPIESLADHGMEWNDAEVVTHRGEPCVPMRCHDCGRPMYYDYADESYHHALDPSTGCFLIPAEERFNDAEHPDLNDGRVGRIVDILCGAIRTPEAYAWEILKLDGPFTKRDLELLLFAFDVTLEANPGDVEVVELHAKLRKMVAAK